MQAILCYLFVGVDKSMTVPELFLEGLAIALMHRKKALLHEMIHTVADYDD